MTRQKENGEITERKKGELEEETEEDTKETKQASSKFEGRKANEDKDESDNGNSAPMTPVNSETSQNGLIEENTENKHADSNAGKNNFEELRNAKRYVKDNIYSPNRVKAMKKIKIQDHLSYRYSKPRDR